MIGSAAPAALHLVFGPPEHGVTRHALDLAAAAGEPVCHLAQPVPPTARVALDAVTARRPGAGTAVHLHVTDRLLGATCEDAAALVEALAAAHPVTVTLHDLPQPSDGAEHFPRRAAAYRRIVAVARAVQLSSRHEQALLSAIAPTVRAVVVPLPVPARPGTGRPSGVTTPGAGTPTVGILGYLYPGKGHAEVLAALDRLDRPEVALAALGRPSPGHEWLVEDLQLRAGSRALEVTGYLDDAELDRRIAGVTVPVVAPNHISASGSLHRWIGGGRRPVTLANPYTREVAEALPGRILLTDDLPSALRAALDRPELTWQSEIDPDGDPVDGAVGAAAAQSAAIRAALVHR